MGRFKFYLIFVLITACNSANKNIINSIESVSLKDNYNNTYLLEVIKIDSFHRDFKKVSLINDTIFPTCYSFIFNNNILVKTDGNILKINNKYYYSKINLISKYFNILEENFCRQNKLKLLDITTIDRIFANYIKFEESVDSEENKLVMMKSLKNIKKLTDIEDLELLINVWMYYDPTDFYGNELILKIFKNNKTESINAIKNRISNKKEWENNETAPYSDLFLLLHNLEISK